MKGLIKITAAVLGLLILLIGIGIFYITSVMDPNDYKPRIEQLALEQAGIQLNIEGDISWSLYPWIGMETGVIRVSFPNQPELARIDSAQVSLQLMPLFSGRVEMSDIILDGLALSLVKDATGNVNWQSTESTQATASSAQESDADIGSGRSTEAISIPDLDIASINIRNGRVEFTDLSANSRIELSDIVLTTGRVALGEVLPINLGFNYRQFDGAVANLEARTQLNTQLAVTSDFQQINLNDLNLTSHVSGAALPNHFPEIKLTGQVQMDLTNEQVVADSLNLIMGALNATGSLQLNDFESLNIAGNLNLARFNLVALMNQLEQPLPKLTDETALTAISLETAFMGDLQKLQFNPLSLTLDGTPLVGNAAVSLDSGHISLVLKGSRLNVDGYLPREETASASGSSSASTSSSGSGWPTDEVIPMETLRGLNLSVTLDLDEMTFAGHTLGKPGLTLSAQNGIVNLERLDTQIYAGNVKVSGRIDARSDKASTQLNAQIHSIQLGQVLKEMADSDLFSGLLSANLDITTAGQSVHSMINHLNGQANIQMKEGVLQGINMAQAVCQGIQTVTALGINPQQVDRSTPFADLSGNFTLRNGVVSNNDLTAMLDAMRLRAQGQINLPAKSLDYRLGFTIMENLFQQTCSVNNRLEGLELPILCAGQFDTPPAQMCRPDTSVFTQLLRREVQREVQRQVEERIGGSVEEQIRERIGGEDGARSLIRGLLR